MYPIDRRKVAEHIYSLLKSLRKVSLLLGTSHSTISRWLKNPDRKQYIRSGPFKSNIMVESIRLCIKENPFISTRTLAKQLEETFKFSVSKELVRVAIQKCGFSKKKAKFFGAPVCLPETTSEFIKLRNSFVQQGKEFISIDETSFGRNGRPVIGYSPVGKPLFVRKRVPRMTTISSVCACSSREIIGRTEKQGSFNTESFCAFLKSLVPIIRPNTVILLDNAKFHHSKEVSEIAKLYNWTLLFVPPYSPWFNPVEGVFSIVKRAFYKQTNIPEAYQTVTSRHLKAFFEKSFSLNNHPFEIEKDIKTT